MSSAAQSLFKSQARRFLRANQIHRKFSAAPTILEQQEQQQQQQQEQQSSPIHVTVTQTKSANTNEFSIRGFLPSIQSDETALVDSLLSHTASLVDISASNIIAFSGGVDSSLAAALVHRTFHNMEMEMNQSDSENEKGSVKAVLGVSHSLPQRQLDLAREVASFIGVELLEVKTTEGADETYISNQGQACFVCKSHLYSALEAVSRKASEISISSSSLSSSHNNTDTSTRLKRAVILYNGTNADDTTDPTRLGLVAASNYSVQSPLLNISKDQVRLASKHLNLPNYNYAASPCLRSRLALGVSATADHLNAVNLAEERVRSVLNLNESMNMRVRMLAGKRAMVELDPQWFIDHDRDGDGNVNSERYNSMTQIAEDLLKSQGFDQYCKQLGFDGGIGLRPFKSGSVSTR